MIIIQKKTKKNIYINKAMYKKKPLKISKRYEN